MTNDHRDGLIVAWLTRKEVEVHFVGQSIVNYQIKPILEDINRESACHVTSLI